MKEIWKDVKGYEGLYQVSNLGRVKSLERVTINNRIVHERILKLRHDKKGYNICCLRIDGEKKFFGVHRLVAKAFIPNANNYPVVNHKDEIKDNNIVDNLEWCTYKYNSNYGTSSKRISEKKKGANNPNSKMVVLLNNGLLFESISEAAKIYGLSRGTINCICKGTKRTLKTDHEGNELKFMYYDDFIKQKERL